MARKKGDTNTENRILEAARRVFTNKGFAAARMDDIAREAGINRALLHYYFRNKDRMFGIIFEQGFQSAFAGLRDVLIADEPLRDKIRSIVDMYFTLISQHPELPRFVINELALNPERLAQIISASKSSASEAMRIFGTQVKDEVKRGTIKPIDGSQLFINVLALTIYPFIARPILKTAMQLDDLSFDKMMAKRKKEVADFIFDAIKPEK